jgi:hypothetical protein
MGIDMDAGLLPDRVLIGYWRQGRQHRPIEPQDRTLRGAHSPGFARLRDAEMRPCTASSSRLPQPIQGGRTSKNAPTAMAP